MNGFAVTFAGAAVAVAALKWLRVIQREHYLPGSAFTMYRLWSTSSVLNRILLPVPAAAVVWALVADISTVPTVMSAAAVAVFPVGLSLRGRTSKLAWTGRLKRLTAILLLVAVAVAVVTTIFGRPAMAALVVMMLFPALCELGVRSAAPLEHRLSQRFVDQASEALSRIGPTVVGITGSYGKTSTKVYVRDLVEGTRRVVASPASYNNRMGLSRAVNEHLADDTEVFVAEMGTYGPGEIAELCAWVPPAIAVMTAIGPVHLERFKTQANIVSAKAEILPSASVAVFNVDHVALRELADRTIDATVWRCGTGGDATDVRVLPGGRGWEIHVRGSLVGTIDANDVFSDNLACAVAVALELGVTESEIVDRAARITSPAHRQTVTTSDAGFTIIDDTFNSNPAGAARALGVLAAHGGAQSRRVLVTPGMVEMGPDQVEGNRKLAEAATAVADDIVIVGRTNRAALREGTRAGGGSVIVVSTRREAVEWVRTQLGAGDVVLYENDLPDHYP